MKYIKSPQTDAFFNMALEEYVFESMPKDDSYFLLWQNRNAVVVGKYQNTVEEINADFVREFGIQVVRRLSGGGAMYQDMGNVNFTYIVDQSDAENLDFSLFTLPVVRALAQLGVTAETNGRNDIVIDGRKFSGNSQYNKKGRTMHHGTLLFDSRLETVQKALMVKADKISSKGIKSVRSRVTNISEHLSVEISVEDFRKVLVEKMFEENLLEEYCLTPEDLKGICKLRDEKYATWEWNYGNSPAFDVRKERRYSFGGLSLLLGSKHGRIESLQIWGDFFGNGDVAELSARLIGLKLEMKELESYLEDVDLNFYIHGITQLEFIELLMI